MSKNGGTLGNPNVPTNGIASGIWKTNEVHQNVSLGGWLRRDGSSAQAAGDSAAAIKAITGTNTDGVYWINLPTVGPTEVFCLMDSAWNGGGWMMAMKATRGTTFSYTSTHWTSITTLNTTSVNRTDADAKFHTMNYFSAKDFLAVFPDIGAGGSIAGRGAWTWLQNDFNSGARTTTINFFNTAAQTRISGGKEFSGWGSGVFSSQSGTQWYGFNFSQYTNARVRWGFAWNNEVNDLNSNDVSGGIGMGGSNIGGQSANFSYSAGDYIGCCNDTTGINRTARVEMFVR